MAEIKDCGSNSQESGKSCQSSAGMPASVPAGVGGRGGELALGAKASDAVGVSHDVTQHGPGMVGKREMGMSEARAVAQALLHYHARATVHAPI